MACGHRDEWTTVPSNATFGLQLALERLEEADLRFEISSFPPLPCGIAIESYHVVLQDPRAPARVRRGSVVRLKLSSPPVPLEGDVVPTEDDPPTRDVPDLVGRRYSDFLRVSRSEGLSMCLAGIPPLPGEASHRGLDAFVVETQDPPAETRVPYRRMIRVTLAIG